jgi:hypothetical protein
MTPAGFKPTIPACERPQTHVLDRAATGIGSMYFYPGQYLCHLISNEINLLMSKNVFV